MNIVKNFSDQTFPDRWLNCTFYIAFKTDLNLTVYRALSDSFPRCVQQIRVSGITSAHEQQTEVPYPPVSSKPND